jgi:hypothetical protein
MESLVQLSFATASQAGIQFASVTQATLGSRLRGNDGHLFATTIYFLRLASFNRRDVVSGLFDIA